jgi:hypothetical protein
VSSSAVPWTAASRRCRSMRAVGSSPSAARSRTAAGIVGSQSRPTRPQRPARSRPISGSRRASISTTKGRSPRLPRWRRLGVCCLDLVGRRQVRLARAVVGGAASWPDPRASPRYQLRKRHMGAAFGVRRRVGDGGHPESLRASKGFKLGLGDSCAWCGTCLACLIYCSTKDVCAHL